MQNIVTYNCQTKSTPRRKKSTGGVSRDFLRVTNENTDRPTGQPSNVSRGLKILEKTGPLVPQWLLVKGAKTGWNLIWQTFMRELAPTDSSGAYQRPTYGFTSRIGSPEFPDQAGRYHVYLGNACPWCHRVGLVIAIRGLTPYMTYSQLISDPERASRGGWVCDPPDPVLQCKDLREIYATCSPGYEGRCTAPLLIDKTTKQIVSNESSDIVRMLNTVKQDDTRPIDLYPASKAQIINDWNALIYPSINNGVYRSGFATSQKAYDAVQTELYTALDKVEEQLSQTRFLAGEKVTEADIRLYPTIIRLDAVYGTLFKCGRKRVSDYKHLHQWLLDMYQLDYSLPQRKQKSLKVTETIDIDDARVNYFSSLFPLNPGGIVASGPTAKDLNLNAEHNRGPIGMETIFHMKS